MPLAFRVAARLDIKAPNLVKTVHLEGLRKLGEPMDYARRYEDDGIDEIVYLDIVASLYQRNALGPILDKTTRDIFTPVMAGGGVRSVDDAMVLLRHGADKVALNTAAIERPVLLTELAHRIGSQSVTLHLDAKRSGNGWVAFVNGGRENTGRDAVEWAREAVALGAGEIAVTSIDQEGTGRGFDIDLVRAISCLPIPVVACGGLGCPDDAVKAYHAGASGIAISGALHYGWTSIREIKDALHDAGVHVRRVNVDSNSR